MRVNNKFNLLVISNVSSFGGWEVAIYKITLQH